MAARSGWKQVNENRWVRRDGAVVKWDPNSPYPNPALPSARMWTAWEPDPSERCLSYTKRNTPFNIPRRWNKPEAAMKAVDKEYPLSAESER